MAKRTTVAIPCPRCGLAGARVIGRSESHPVVYLKCTECGRVSVVPE
jgi:uncharacterized Zn finger protein